MQKEPIHNSYLSLLIQDSDILTTLQSLDIERLEDHTTKVICRTILGSIDALQEHLQIMQETDI